ncbi:platelet endothelial cell adhesion molecule isoform X1 [Pygocentrus nattereri]|uniref:platelet endothelial cell adhesion molecule isoform X1 n=1 Tax=Pygocentrus nattereri TaxID=42514 RepID=UPI001890EDFF|nr:platelet endothelial cell adhesion molecule isoform X1 [Pygocentrus nattereri]
MRATRTCLLLLFLLFLFTCTEAQSEFIIKSVKLFVHPAKEVERGTNLTLTCNAQVSHTGGRLPQYTYNFYKNFERKALHIQKMDAVEQVNFSIPNARAFDSGIYRCELVIEQQNLKSQTESVKVKGLQVPELIVDKQRVSEGESVSATCRAEEEKGSLQFSFKDGTNEVHRESSEIGHVQTILTFHSARIARLSCLYLINQLESNISNVVTVEVQELDIRPTITFQPSTEVIEGDTVQIFCRVDSKFQNSTFSLKLIKGKDLLKPDMKNSNYSKVVQATDTGEYECRATINSVTKTDAQNLTVKELFSKPILTITPVGVFEGQPFTVTCKSSDFASERISRDQVKYSILMNGQSVTLGAFNGEYNATASTQTNGNYTCNAQANNILKWSQLQIFKAKMLVSKPIIEVVDKVVLDRPFKIHCRSEYGSFPINYTLIRNQKPLNQILSWHENDHASFSAVISTKEEIQDYKCIAQNSQNSPPLMSDALSAPVIVPVKKVSLVVLPGPDQVIEGTDVYLICNAGIGTPPISFKWYRLGNNSALMSNTVQVNNSAHKLPKVSSKDSGTYYCEAYNNGIEHSQSDKVTFTVRMAHWKIGIIATVCLLLLALSVVVLLKYRSKRVGVVRSVWSQRPPDTGDSGDVVDMEEPNVEYTEVLHPQADPTRIPLKKGTDTVYSELQTAPQGEVHDYWTDRNNGPK